MTNRLGRPLDRIRALTVELRVAEGEHARASLLCLVLSLALFAWDIQLGLNSIRIEIDRWKPE
jgi:hypothetical protein